MKIRGVNLIVFIIWATGLCLTLVQAVSAEAKEMYGVAKWATPVLNVSDFSLVFGGEDGKTLHQDRSGLIREVEFIALPGTVFKLIREIVIGKIKVYEVTTKDYPYPSQKGYFIDSRFVEITNKTISNRIKKLPSKEFILERLLNRQGCIYIWGGNCSEGVAQLLSFYPPVGLINSETKKKWQLKGLDCSGLLYEATDGWTPRNTSALVNFGEAVEIENLNAEDIIRKLDPLDLIVWKGHVIIVIDKKTTIESHLRRSGKKDKNNGVEVRSLEKVLEEILQERIPVDDYEASKGKKKFVIRRWYEYFSAELEHSS